MKKSLIIFILFGSVCFSYGQNEIWQTAIYAEDEWRYISGSADIPNNWRELGFDDSGWSVGPGSIGYGDNDDATIIPEVFSLYMRKTFAVSDKSKILGGLLNADFDDGFVAYLNGVEIARSNVDGAFPSWNADAIDFREAMIYSGGTPLNFFSDEDVLQELLLDGENVLAIQTHNRDGLSSSDLTSLYWMSFLSSEPMPGFGEFHIEGVQDGEQSDLPIVKINTFGIEIPDEPKIDAELGIVWDASGGPNDFSAFANEYSGNIRIEKRGQSSLFFFPKNSYGFELVDEEGNDMDASFLNFPEEEDFILHGPYSDKTLMRNVLIFELANQVGQYATRTRYVELEVNGFYEGIYVMMERIKRDKERVDIAKLREEDIEGDELTGGYIFKIDKGQPDWLSQYDIQNNPGAKLHFQYVYPRRENIMPEQAQYIQTYVDSFERALRSPNVPVNGKYYDDFIDLASFVDHFLLVELAKDVDGYRFSTYLHKDKDSKGGKLKCGPLWDFNLSFGNADYCQGWEPEGWMYNLHCDNGNPFWWNTLFSESKFRNHAKCRWEELRQTVFHRDSIYAMIDANRDLLDSSLDRNYEKWPILGQYVWPNFYVPFNYPGEINVLKQFVADRLEWMDNAMLGVCDSTLVVTPGQNFDFVLAPNPASNILTLQFEFAIEESFDFVIYNELGIEIPIYNQGVGEKSIDLDVSHLPKGIYFLTVFNDDEEASVKKFVVVD